MGSIFSPKTFVTFAAFCLLAQGDTVTITKKICPTPTARTTTTTVQSTVFVYPSGWSDSTVNGGTPFVISLFQGGSGPYKRDTTHAAASYLLANGNTTTEYTQAAQYQIVGGQLQLTDGTLLSTNPDTPSMPFLASDNIGSITKTFTCINGSLIWTNTAFNKGYAQFYTNPVNQPSNARTLISFNSLMGYDTEWGLVSLAPQPVPQSGGGSLSGYTHSTTATETPPASASTSGLADISGGLSHYTHGSPTTVSASTSQSTLPTPGSGSPDGSCGHYNGFTCVGAFSGTCCSAYGFCGTGDLYCGAGCQPGYGSCGGSDSGTSTTSVFVSTNLTATPINTVSTSQISVVTTSTPTTTPGSLTPDGSCGGSNGYTCIGAFSGSCCSPFGFCGSGAGYCDTGCQADYGLCDSTGYESSTKTWPTTSQVSIPSGKITIVTTSSVTSPTPTPGGLTPDGSCGGANGYTCIGAFSGSCCSGFGFCGSGEGYCDAGCQPAYGTCHNGSLLTTSSTPSPTPIPTSSSPSSVSFSTSSTSSSAWPSTTSSPLSSSPMHSTSTATSSVSTPTAGGLTPDGSCGGANGYSCIGAFSGSCCSAFGFCGSGSGYCGSGCQSQFGNCDSTGTSSSTSSSDSTGSSSISPQMSHSSTQTSTVMTSSSINTVHSSTSTMTSTTASSPFSTIRSTGSSMTTASTSSSSQSPQPTQCNTPGADMDDGYYQINLPFNMTIFGYTTSTIFPSSNGLLTLDNGSMLYDAAPLPDTRFACPVLEPWFDDLYIYGERRADASVNGAGSSSVNEGIYYTTTATDLNVTYILSRVGTFESYIFSVLYSTKQPGLLTFAYMTAGGPGSGASDGGGVSDTSANNGATAAIGIQRPYGDGTYDAIQWSYFQSGSVSAGYTINCDTTQTPPICEGTDGRTVTGVNKYHATWER